MSSAASRLHDFHPAQPPVEADSARQMLDALGASVGAAERAAPRMAPPSAPTHPTRALDASMTAAAQSPSSTAGFEKSFLGTPAAARTFVRLARRPGGIAAAGGGISRRMLVSAPQGFGKETLARAVAAELQAGFAVLAGEDAQTPERLAEALARLDGAACAARRSTVVYFELVGCPHWAPDPERARVAYDAWLRVWTSGRHRHLYIVVGVADGHRVDAELEDAVALHCKPGAPSASVRRSLWERALRRAGAGGAVTHDLDADAFDKVVVRPSEGLGGGDIAQAAACAIRAAIVEQPDAEQVVLKAEHFRAAISRRRSLQLERSISLLGHLQLA